MFGLVLMTGAGKEYGNGWTGEKNVLSYSFPSPCVVLAASYCFVFFLTISK